MVGVWGGRNLLVAFIGVYWFFCCVFWLFLVFFGEIEFGLEIWKACYRT